MSEIQTIRDTAAIAVWSAQALHILHMCYAENDIENYSFKCAIATTGWRNLVDNDKRFNVD